MYIIYERGEALRTLVDIPDKQVQDLAKICNAEDLSRAEVIRRAISEYVEKNQRTEVDAFGLWLNTEITLDGLELQEKLRNEW